MRKNERMYGLRRALGLFCTLVLLVCALYVPMAMNVSAIVSVPATEDTAVVFDFENTVTDNGVDNKNEAVGPNGIGYFSSWVGKARQDSANQANKVLQFIKSKSNTNSYWRTGGGYRLHTKLEDGTYGFYSLEPSKRYVVSFDIRVPETPITVNTSSSPTSTAAVYLGWGSSYDPTVSSSGTHESYVNGMSDKKIKVMDALIDSNSFNLYSQDGAKISYAPGNQWRTVTYAFETPASFTGDTALSFWADLYSGTTVEIDNLSVIKLGDNTGTVVLLDEYSESSEALIGAIGTAVVLPDISDRAQSSDHIFNNWCKDQDRTQSAEGITFTKANQFVYSKWRAPVKITFYNTLNSTSQVISGIGGEPFEYPADPIDPENKTWFMGWYTNTAFSEEHTSGRFPYRDITLYSYWKSEVLSVIQDFENYDKDYWTPKEIVYDNGTPDDKSDDYIGINKSNYLHFSPAMVKQTAVTTGPDSKYAIKFNWDNAMVKDTSKPDGENIKNPEAYNSKAHANYHNFFYLTGELEDKQVYILTFKYKVEKADTDVRFDLISALSGNAWGSYMRTEGERLQLEVSDEWQEYTIEFNTNFKSANASHMFLNVYLFDHEDATIYFDDFEFKPYAQPYESVVTIYPNQGDSTIHLKGVRGQTINYPEIEHADSAPFLGWYTNQDLTEEFTVTTFPRKPVTVYAKWGAAPITFKRYPYEASMKNNLRYDPLFVIENKPGIGYDDDYAMHWKFSRPNESSETGTKFSHVFPISENLESGEVYYISYYYKGTSATNVETHITPVQGCGNIWETGLNTNLEAGAGTVPAGGCGWKKAEFYFTPNIQVSQWGSVSKFLYLWVHTDNDNVGITSDIIIDNVLVEKVSAPYVYFDCTNGVDSHVFRGKPGDKIEYPKNPEKFAKIFNGWYYDRECTQKFDLETFADDTKVIAYAGWKDATTITYSFEQYDPNPNPTLVLRDGEISTAVAKTGKQSMHLGNRTPGNFSARSFLGIRQGRDVCTIEYNSKYLVTVNYYVKSFEPGNMNITFYASMMNNIWDGLNRNAVISDTQTISNNNATQNKGKWATKTFLIDTKGVEDSLYGPMKSLYMVITGGDGWDIYFDDITITPVPKDKMAVAIDTNDCSGIPSYIIGNKGASFASKFPTAPQMKGLRFKGYFTKASDGSYRELTRENMVFSEKIATIYARFLDLEIREDFEKGYAGRALDDKLGYTIYDFDYEVYDSEAEGNSKENVTNGRYSLHRKGNSMYFENAVILTLGNQISEGERYTVSFKVKLGDYKQTDGAIKVVSGRSFKYAWTTTGDYHPVVAIADLLDGQWHEVSCTFNSVEAFLSVQTPGYVELYMDEFKFTLEDKDTPVSAPIKYTEYVPAERDADGNLIKADKGVIDVTSIIDISLYMNNGIWLWIIIGVAAVLVIGGGVFAFVLIKKKKQNKA